MTNDFFLEQLALSLCGSTLPREASPALHVDFKEKEWNRLIITNNQLLTLITQYPNVPSLIKVDAGLDQMDTNI